MATMLFLLACLAPPLAIVICLAFVAIKSLLAVESPWRLAQRKTLVH